MAETTTATTRPARARKATSAPAKAASTAAPKTSPRKAPQAEVTNVTRFRVELEPVGETKSYAKFAAPANYAGVLVGTLYAPIGTQRVAVLVIGEGDSGAEETE